MNLWTITYYTQNNVVSSISISIKYHPYTKVCSLSIFVIFTKKQYDHTVDHTKYLRNVKTFKKCCWYIKAMCQYVIYQFSVSYVNLRHIISFFWWVAKVTQNGQSYPILRYQVILNNKIIIIYYINEFF